MTLQPVHASVLVRSLSNEEPSLTVRRFSLVESVEQPFSASITLVSDDLDLDVRALLGARVRLDLERPGFGHRTLVGTATGAAYVATRNEQLLLSLEVEPSMSLLRHSTRRRIFSDQTVLEILESVAAPVFSVHGGRWDVSRLTTSFEPADYVVQYDESDLDFVLRLLSESGLCVLNAAEENLSRGEADPVYVLTEANAGLPGCGMVPTAAPSGEPTLLAFVPNAAEEAQAPGVQGLRREDAVRPLGVRSRARDWKTRGGRCYETSVAQEVPHGVAGNVWEYHPGRLGEGQGSNGAHLDHTEAWAHRELEDRQRGGIVVRGESNVVGLTAGATFELDGHPHRDLDDRYAVRRVEHGGDFPQVEHASASSAPTYTSTFEAVPLATTELRPALRPRPRTRGIESATVVGPEGGEVRSAAFGRVRVRFHWDDAAPAGAGQTCWLRVLSPWAGPGYGASFIPRVGMEVVVDFLGGDPDRPVVTGCLYTGTNMPPGALPQSKTCTTLRSQSTPSDGQDRQGFNELRFEDAAGHEEVFLHAERNLKTVVRASQSTSIGASRSLSISADSTRTVGGTESICIGGGDSDEPGSLDVHVAGSERRTIEQDHELNVLKTAIWRVEESLVANATVGARISCDDTGSSLTLEPTSGVLEATKSIELRVGKTSLKLTPKGITMEGEVISANVERQLWLASEAGRVSLNNKGAEVFGGAKSESVLRLRAQSLETKAKGLLRQSGKGVLVTGTELVNLEAAETKVVGFSKTTLRSGGAMDVDAAGPNDIKGKPINLN